MYLTSAWVDPFTVKGLPRSVFLVYTTTLPIGCYHRLCPKIEATAHHMPALVSGYQHC